MEVCGEAAPTGLADGLGINGEALGLDVVDDPSDWRGRGCDGWLALAGACGARVSAGFGAALASTVAASLGTKAAGLKLGSIVGTSSGRIEGRLDDGA